MTRRLPEKSAAPPGPDTGLESPSSVDAAVEQLARRPWYRRALASGRRLRAIGVTDLAAGALWIVIVGAVFGLVTHRIGSERRPKATPAFGQAASAPAPARPAGGSAAAGAAATAQPTPGVPLPNAAVVADSALLRPGAVVVDRVNLPGFGPDPGAAVLYSEAPAADGCRQPFIDLLRPDGRGGWAPICDATAAPAGGPPLAPPVARTDAGCFPAVALFSVRPLERDGPPYALMVVTQADGTQRIVALAWNGITHQTAVLSDQRTAPGAEIALRDGQPAVLSVSEPVFLPAAVDAPAATAQPIGRLTRPFTWAGAGFAPSAGTFTLNCLSGTVARLLTNAPGPGLLLRCDGGGGAFAAVSLSADTQFGGGYGLTDLAVGDDVTVALVSGPPPVDAPPLAVRLQSAAAALRRQPTATVQIAARPTQAPIAAVSTRPPSTPQPPVPTVQAAPAPTAPPQFEPTAAPPATAAPLPVQTVSSRPVPPQPVATETAPARAVPPQPTATRTVQPGSASPQPR